MTALKCEYEGITKKQAALDKLNAELTKKEETIKSLRPLAEAVTALERLKEELHAANERLTALTALQKEYDAICGKQLGLSAAQNEFEALNAEYITADGRYKALYERFLHAQAGVLARTLSEGEPCPVCGSLDHPAPAEMHEEEVSESKLKKLNTEAEAAKKRLDAKASECSAGIEVIDTLSVRFSESASKLLGSAPEDAGALLESETEQARAAVAELTVKKDADKRALAELTETTEITAKRREELSPKCTSLTAEIETLTARFLKDFSEFAPNISWESAGAES